MDCPKKNILPRRLIFVKEMAPEELGLDELKPYKSIILGEITSEDVGEDFVEDCLDAIGDILKLEEDGSSKARNRTKESSEENVETSNESLEHGFIHYKLKKSVTWTDNNEIADTEHHLVLLTRNTKIDFVALYVSENSRRRAIREKFGNDNCSGLQYLTQIAPKKLNSAFFGDQVRTLWLSGMHRRVEVKADSKILSGPDLRYALDPIHDQTFYHSAVRTNHSDLESAVGISPKKSRVWTQRSSDWDDYRRSVTEILNHLENEDDSEQRPLPVLAEFAETSDLGSPYELIIQPSELLSQDVEIDDERRKRLEQWAYNTEFDIDDGSSSERIEADVYHTGVRIAEITIGLDTSDPLDVDISASMESTDNELPDVIRFEHDDEDDSNEGTSEESEFKGDEDEESDTGEVEEDEEEELPDTLIELKELCEEEDQIKVYFDSGHTLSNGSFYKARYRDQRFDKFLWLDFADYVITKEKPKESDFPAEGDHIEWDDDPSLFKWVYENWPPDEEPWEGAPRGWLACDDGNMEVADFVHLTTKEDGPSLLSLIHVKGAGSDSSGREISVSKYEKVTAQAVKHLRELDYETLGSGLKDSISTKISNYVWNDGERADRDDMVAEIEDLGTNYEAHVVVLQPHVQMSHRQETREMEGTQDYDRLMQLETLLNGAKSSCSGMGATFHVISSNE